MIGGFTPPRHGAHALPKAQHKSLEEEQFIFHSVFGWLNGLLVGPSGPAGRRTHTRLCCERPIHCPGPSVVRRDSRIGHWPSLLLQNASDYHGKGEGLQRADRNAKWTVPLAFMAAEGKREREQGATDVRARKIPGAHASRITLMHHASRSLAESSLNNANTSLRPRRWWGARACGRLRADQFGKALASRYNCHRHGPRLVILTGGHGRRTAHVGPSVERALPLREEFGLAGATSCSRKPCVGFGATCVPAPTGAQTSLPRQFPRATFQLQNARFLGPSSSRAHVAVPHQRLAAWARLPFVAKNNLERP